MGQLNRIEDLPSNSTYTPINTPMSPAAGIAPRNRRAGAANKQARKLSESDMKRSEEAQLLLEAQRREKQIAQEEMRRTNEEKHRRELQYKNRVRDEIRAQEEKERELQEQEAKKARDARAAAKVAAREAKLQAERKAREAKEAKDLLIRETAPPRPDMPHTDYEALFASMKPTPVSETVKDEIESIQASHASSPSPQSAVESLIAARVQNMRERAGDYSRFLPSHLGVDRNPGKSVGPVPYAELALSRVRGAGLAKRREAAKVVKRLVKTGTVTGEKLEL